MVQNAVFLYLWGHGVIQQFLSFLQGHGGCQQSHTLILQNMDISNNEINVWSFYTCMNEEGWKCGKKYGEKINDPKIVHSRCLKGINFCYIIAYIKFIYIRLVSSFPPQNGVTFYNVRKINVVYHVTVGTIYIIIVYTLLASSFWSKNEKYRIP